MCTKSGTSARSLARKPLPVTLYSRLAPPAESAKIKASVSSPSLATIARLGTPSMSRPSSGRTRAMLVPSSSSLSAGVVSGSADETLPSTSPRVSKRLSMRAPMVTVVSSPAPSVPRSQMTSTPESRMQSKLEGSAPRKKVPGDSSNSSMTSVAIDMPLFSTWAS